MSKVQTWSVTDVGRWLEKIVKLPQYKTAFEENEITGTVLLELKGDDLREIGVSKVGHRKQIELAIGALRAQLFYATLAIPNNGSLTSSQASLFAQPNMDIALSLDNNDASEPSARAKEKQPARKRPTSPSSSQHDHVAAATSSLVVSDGSLGPQPSPKKQRLVQHKSAGTFLVCEN